MTPLAADRRAGPVEASVVIATRNRESDLRRCIEALGRQRTGRDFEVVVVDDGSDPPVAAAALEACPGARLVRLEAGSGPARARNRGISEAAGAVVLFTDDDTIPSSGWLEAACSFLERTPECVGVEGPTESPPFDELYAYSVENRHPGAYWTCNVAYRRRTLERLDGFCTAFSSAHCEDLDLGFRALRLGPIGFAEEMRVVHVPRPVSIGQLIRGARSVSSELLLFARHPERYRSPIPRRLLPLSGYVRHASRLVGRERERLAKEPRRLARLAVVTIGQLALAFVTVIGSRPAGPSR